ncbi:Xaa-Pro peptidase family protein [Virgibacillus sp. C22-A2]|uniref:Xaa-Pro peptidase family protein n=1 Tax=Virgibacillus tibetensis TaxID=3042313 RepID=A0ABU6K9X0_9BACI|nr:Xaa-Pro peptidase family protein [Virgibacillus sp. C22-A2]
MSERLESLIKELKRNNLDSMLITSKANFYYLSNYYTEPHERIIAVYVSTLHDPILIVPAMEVDDAKAAGWNHEIISYHDHENPWQLFSNKLKAIDKTPQTIGLEHDHITLERYEAIKEILPSATITDAQEIVANLRVIKSKEEYELIKEAASLADFGIETGVKSLREGIGELEVIATIEYELKKQGIQEMSFNTMALSGTKTASPHGTPSIKEIISGDMVLFDLGVIYKGYCSDISRTVAFKSVTDQQKDIYNTVLAAEQKSIDASQIGTPVGELDLAARNHIEEAGYGKYFTHRIGHGLGIQTHEYPSMHSNNNLLLKAGMCYTIEPGIYVPEIGGVRIEDMIFMTENGPEILTKYPKELQIIE